MLRKLLKDGPKIFDQLRLRAGPASTPAYRGIRMPDGSPVSVETIMRTHSVDRERAIKIAQRQTR